MNSKLDELLKEADLPKAADLIGRAFQCSFGDSIGCVGTITSVDNFNDDGWLSLGVTSKKYRGDDIESLDYSGREWRLIVRSRAGKTEAIRRLNFELVG